MKRKALLSVALSVLLVTLIAGAASAQGTNPPATPKAPLVDRLLKGLGPRIFAPLGDWKNFDAVAAALKLTPTQLFEALHSGKTLEEIATAQGVEMTAIQETLKTNRQAQARDAIRKALENGKLTQEQADWMSKGLENGWRFPRLPQPGRFTR